MVGKNLIDKNIDILAITFNAPGLGYILENENISNNKYKNKIYNCVITNDFIGTFKSHIGDTYYMNLYPQYTIKQPNEKDYDTPHGCIIDYTEDILGSLHSKPTGLGTNECWALWIYDKKNKSPLKHTLKIKIHKKDLEHAIEIIKNCEICCPSCFKFKAEGTEYTLEKNFNKA